MCLGESLNDVVLVCHVTPCSPVRERRALDLAFCKIVVLYVERLEVMFSVAAILLRYALTCKLTCLHLLIGISVVQ